MEHFDPKPNAVKEKNLYIVHLDTPRIIILSSVIIGIIAAAFLFGMTFMKDDRSSSKELTISGIDFNENKTAEIIGSDIPPVPRDSLEDNGLDDKIASTDINKNDLLPDEGSKNLTDSHIATAKDDIKQEKGDVLTSESIKEIIPPASEKRKNMKKPAAVATKNKKQEKSRQLAENNRNKKENRNPSTESGDRGRLYEVSRDLREKSSRGSFSVQVASYDTLAKAEKEKSLLKSKRYDAYIDRGNVNGKSYYRVRIGPMSSSKSAYDLLNDIQNNPRYSASYMVKE